MKVAILSAVTVVVLTGKRRYGVPAIVGIVILAAAVTLLAISAMVNAGDLLLTRLDLIAEIDQMNQ